MPTALDINICVEQKLLECTFKEGESTLKPRGRFSTPPPTLFTPLGAQGTKASFSPPFQAPSFPSSNLAQLSSFYQGALIATFQPSPFPPSLPARRGGEERKKTRTEQRETETQKDGGQGGRGATRKRKRNAITFHFPLLLPFHASFLYLSTPKGRDCENNASTSARAIFGFWNGRPLF